MRVLLWLTLIAFTSLGVCIDPNLSNGTCYFGAGQEAGENFIPCGNAADGVHSCCQARDVCLSSNACFNGQYYITYLAGCTDESYSDPACPNKGDFSDQQWVGLVRCFVSNNTDEEWGACEEPHQSRVNDANQDCTCDPSSSTAVFTDDATLTNIASLPVSIGNDIAWFPGFSPSTTISDVTSSRSTSSTITVPTRTSVISGSITPGPSFTASDTGSPVSTSSSSSSSSSTTTPLTSSPALSTGAKAGIGVGTAGGFLTMGALLFAALRYSRKQKKNKDVPPIEDQIRPQSFGTWRTGGTPRMAGDQDEMVEYQPTPWGGKSELPTEANETPPRIRRSEEMAGAAVRNGLTTPGQSYQPYRRSPTIGASEVDGSPAASSSGLVPRAAGHEKPTHDGPIYELPA